MRETLVYFRVVWRILAWEWWRINQNLAGRKNNKGPVLRRHFLVKLGRLGLSWNEFSSFVDDRNVLSPQVECKQHASAPTKKIFFPAWSIISGPLQASTVFCKNGTDGCSSGSPRRVQRKYLPNVTEACTLTRPDHVVLSHIVWDLKVDKYLEISIRKRRWSRSLKLPVIVFWT